jgi:large subunit ribosomal protein L15
MDLSRVQPKTKRTGGKRVGRGGKRGTTSGAGTKGQKSRSGKGIKVGFRGGDNRIWQLFPKLRGASSRAGSKRPHRKHRYARFPKNESLTLNVGELGRFKEGETVSPSTLVKKGYLSSASAVKILGTGTLKKKLTFEGIQLSASAKKAVENVGGTIQ